jgi:trehalose 6-phosphate phosphatase
MATPLPHYLFSIRNHTWTMFVEQLSEARGVVLFLDYDGTLVPIKRTPSEAVLSRTVQRILRQLSKSPNIRLVIITGREMADIRSMVRLRTIDYAANHGLHMMVSRREWKHPEAVKSRKGFHLLSLALKNNLKDIRGVFIEDKRYTLSIHFRNIEKKDIHSMKLIINDVLGSCGHRYRISRGKKVIEIRPKTLWGKGRSISKILNEYPNTRRWLRIFIGDDITDEDGFKALGPGGISIRVGRSRNTEARFYVNNTHEVIRLLKALLDRTVHTRSVSRVPAASLYKKKGRT